MMADSVYKNINNSNSMNSVNSGGKPSNLALLQLVRRILLGSRVSANDWSHKEAILMSMSESLLSSSLTPTVNISNDSQGVLEMCHRRLGILDPTLQGAVRFSALSTAFLASGDATAVYGKVRVTGGDRFGHSKLALLYFLLRLSERRNGSNGSSQGKSLFEMMKGAGSPESGINPAIAQLNSKIQAALDRDGSVHPQGPAYSHNPQLRNTSYSAPQAQPVLSLHHDPSLTAWDQFEAIKKADYGGISEEMLLRDLIYLLQGLEGNYIQRITDTNGRQYYAPREGLRLSRPLNSMISKLGQLGIDYVFLQRSLNGNHPSGRLRQSFNRAIAHELTEYLKLVAFLEGKLNAIGSASGGSTLDGAAETPISLKAVLLWFHEAGQLLRLLREAVVAAEGRRGAALLSLLEELRSHGNEAMGRVFGRILEAVLVPFREILNGWLGEGVLQEDGFKEFFIVEVAAHGSGSAGTMFATSNTTATCGSEFWQNHFQLRPAEIPSFLSEDLVKKILVTGKSRKLIQRLQSSGLGMMITEQADLQLLPSSPQQDGSSGSNLLGHASLEPAFARIVKGAYDGSCGVIRHLLMGEGRLLDQLECIHRYLLLSRGDFCASLMDSLWEGLSRPASSLFRHNLVGILESALRPVGGSLNPAGFDALLDNLDVRLMPHDRNDSKSGWDVFTLDYRVGFPLDCILDPLSMQEYSKLSRRLWGLKRLESTLSRSWQQHLIRNRRGGSHLLKRVQLLHFEMSTIVHQLLAVAFETLNAQWKLLRENLLAANDLDEMISIHRNHLISLKEELKFWSNATLKTRMQALTASILQFDSCLNNVVVDSANLMSAARQFQGAVDDLFLALQRSESTTDSPKIVNLLNRLDYNDYHRRRNGFDHRKYLLE